MFGFFSGTNSRSRKLSEELSVKDVNLFLSQRSIRLIYDLREDVFIEKHHSFGNNTLLYSINKSDYKDLVLFFDKYVSVIFDELGLNYQKKSNQLKKDQFGFFGGGYDDKEVEGYIYYIVKEFKELAPSKYKYQLQRSLNIQQGFLLNNKNPSYGGVFEVMRGLVSALIYIKKNTYFDNIKDIENKSLEEEKRQKKEKKDNIDALERDQRDLQWELDRIPEVDPLEERKYYQIISELAELEKIVKKKQWDKLNTTEKEDFVLKGGGFDE